jgi:hypothetical protein
MRRPTRSVAVLLESEIKKTFPVLIGEIMIFSKRDAWNVHMTNTSKDNPEDLVKAFRKAAKELGCLQSDKRFREELVRHWQIQTGKRACKTFKIFQEDHASAITA